MTLMIDAFQRQSTENISKYFSDFLHSMTTITRLVLLLPIDEIRSLERVKQKVEKNATVDVTMSTYPSAYAKSRIVEDIFMTLGTGDHTNRCRRIAVLIMCAS
jgi:F0F1-type ATP synthase gamma subunit